MPDDCFTRTFLRSVLAAALLLAAAPAAPVHGQQTLSAWGVGGGAAAPDPGLPEEMVPDEAFELVYVASDQAVRFKIRVRVGNESAVELWNSQAARLFAMFDEDGDKVLADRELLAFKRAVGELTGVGAGSSTAEKLPAALTPEDLPLALATLKMRPLRVQASSVPGGTQRSYGQPAGRPDHNRQLFRVLDRDGSGGLSPEEVRVGLEALARLDANDDETLSVDELSTGVVNNAFVAQPVPQRRNTVRPLSCNLFILRNGTQEQVVNEIFNVLDRSGGSPDGILDVDELPPHGMPIGQLDCNGSGDVDQDELGAWLRSGMPAVELRMQVQPDAKQPEPALEVVLLEPPPGLTHVRGSQGEAAFQCSLLQLDIQARAVPLVPGPDGQPMRQRGFARQNLMSYFQNADGDNNKYVDRQEMRQRFFPQSVFRAADVDADGKLFDTELQAYVDRLETLSTGCLQITLADRGQTLFNLFDNNRDGRLNRREFLMAAERIGQWDRNGNGALELNELPRSVTALVQQAEIQIQEIGSVVELPGGPRAVYGVGPVWFQRMDRNRDGDLTPREFLGDAEQFRRLDANGDGVISPEEGLAAK